MNDDLHHDLCLIAKVLAVWIIVLAVSSYSALSSDNEARSAIIRGLDAAGLFSGPAPVDVTDLVCLPNLSVLDFIKVASQTNPAFGAQSSSDSDFSYFTFVRSGFIFFLGGAILTVLFKRTDGSCRARVRGASI